MLIFFLLTFGSFSAAETTGKTECTEELKARASLKFSECQDPLLPLKECYQLYPQTLVSGSLRSYQLEFDNKSHEAEYCKSRANMSSCEHLTYLTQVCGAHYDACHTAEEKREIMRMWMKQFVQGTHELYWEFAFSDNNKEIVDGDCDHILNQYFDAEEVVEITAIVNTGPNLFDNCSIDERGLEHEWLCSTKISNLTQEFGVLRDKDGLRIDYRNDTWTEDWTKPSHWKYCSWKMKHKLYHKGLFQALSYLFRCDGKCNTNDGDDQEWSGGDPGLVYIDKKTNKRHQVYRHRQSPIFGEGSIHSCLWKAKSDMKHAVRYYVDEDLDVDHVKMELCSPFKTIVENCTIPMSECIEDIAIKEIVMAEMLREMVESTKIRMDWVKNATQADFLGGFSHHDCIIFGGDVAAASLHSPKWGQIVTTFMVLYFFISYNTQ